MRDRGHSRCHAMTALGNFGRRQEVSDRNPPDTEGAYFSAHDDIDAVVFSGGGARCFWQAGFWRAVKDALPSPAVVAAVSGGAALATILFAGGWSRFFPRFLELAASSGGNLQLGNLLRWRRVFPHPRISRDSFLHSVSLPGLERLCEGPDLRIVISHPPRLLGAWLGSVAAAAVCGIEKGLTKRLCPLWVGNLGFRTSVVRARDCSTPEELVHAIFQSSAAPPVFPVTRRNGRPALDGGLTPPEPYGDLDRTWQPFPSRPCTRVRRRCRLPISASLLTRPHRAAGQPAPTTARRRAPARSTARTRSPASAGGPSAPPPWRRGCRSGSTPACGARNPP